MIESLDTLASRSGLVTTYCEVLKSSLVRQQAVSSLGVPPELARSYRINCTVLPDSSVLQLRVQGPSPTLAVDLGNAIGQAGLEYVQGLQEIFELRFLDAASASPDPIAPDHKIDIGISAAVGLLAGIVVVVIRYIIQTYVLSQAAQVPEVPDHG